MKSPSVVVVGLEVAVVVVHASVVEVAVAVVVHAVGEVAVAVVVHASVVEVAVAVSSPGRVGSRRR